MAHWLRCEHEGRAVFGSLEDGQVAVHQGDMFSAPTPTGERLPLGSVRLLAPTEPSKMIGLWNNLGEAAAEAGRSAPPEPLFFFKAPSCFLAPGGTIVKPRSYEGRVLFEAELGVVIGRRCRDVPESEVDECIFGYTCVNDVTAVQMLHADSTFPQWSRCKSLDTFGPFGPVVATGIDPESLRITGLVNGEVRQDYPVSDMFFGPRALVRRLSRDMTLMPGDVIACGTSRGDLAMEPGAEVDIVIEGIGTLSNSYASLDLQVEM